MTQPERYVLQGCESNVSKLVKSLYRLKQAHKMWHDKLDKTTKSNRFVSSLSDRCLYYRAKLDFVAKVCLYVDDILVSDSNFSIVAELKV